MADINESKELIKAALLVGRRARKSAKQLFKNPNMTTKQKIKYAITKAGIEGHKAAETLWDYPMNVTTPTSGALYTAAGTIGGPALKIKQLADKLRQRKNKKLSEQSQPINKKLWNKAVSLAKQKFDVYPSKYANQWAAKWYKSKGGEWKTLNEDYEHEMARNELRTAIRGIERLMKHLDGEGELEAWVQSKLTKAADYIDTLADYMDSRDETVKEAYMVIEKAKKKIGERIPPTVMTQTTHSNPYADDSQSPSYNINVAESGAGEIGTTELTSKYVEHTPGQLPLTNKPKLSKTLKKAIKESVLNEAPMLGAGKRTARKPIKLRRPRRLGRKPTVATKRAPSMVGRKPQTGKPYTKATKRSATAMVARAKAISAMVKARAEQRRRLVQSRKSETLQYKKSRATIG